MRGPQGAGVQKNRGEIVNDEFERVVVTGQRPTIGKLAEQQEHDPGKHGKRQFDANEKHHENHPRKGRFKFSENRATVAAHQLKKIFLPAFPHR